MSDKIQTEENAIYQLDGKIPVAKAIPFGLQHILAMFVANIAPILIVAGVVKLPVEQSAALVQSAMIVAGIGTLIQLYPVWRIGSRLPIVMGISFTFVSTACVIGSKYGMGGIVGAVLVGGIIEGVLGLFSQYWRKLVPPIVAACVVTSIGFSLLTVGANSFGGGFGHPQFGDSKFVLVGTITLVSCLLFNVFAKSFYKQLSVLFGLCVGYVVAAFLGLVNLSKLSEVSAIALPEIMPFSMEFHLDAIIAFTLIFFVSAAETLGDTSALTAMALNRDVNDKEAAGSISCDGFVSSISAMFGCMPITSFSQNIGLVAMTHVINRFAIMTGAVIMILCGFIPALGVLLASLPEPVLGGCTIMMFGSIVISGMRMIAKCGFTERNLIITSLSLSIGIGFTQNPQIFKILPAILKTVFAENCVAVVFVVAVILNMLMPTSMDKE